MVAVVLDTSHDARAGLWAVVNNAGVCIYGEFDWMTTEQALKQVDVNLLGTIRLTKAFLPLVKEAKGRLRRETWCGTFED